MAEATVTDPPVDTTAEEIHPNGNGAAQPVRPLPDRTPLSQRDPVSIAKHFAACGYFADALELSQAVVKIIAGEELGFGPMTAMAGIHIIDGKPALSSNLLATCVKRTKFPNGESNPYTYRVSKITDKEASVKFFERGPRGGQQEIGTSKFTIEMAKRARLVKDKSGWVKFPEAMLFARALSQGVRWFCPDVTAGQPAYTPEELGAEVDQHGEVVALPAPAPAPAADAEPVTPDRIDQVEQGITRVGLTYKALDLLFGTIGADAMRVHSQKARRERLESLGAEQLEALESEVNGLADNQGVDDGE